MTDHELLEMAAKAAGIPGAHECDKSCCFVRDDMDPGKDEAIYWNPLTDDGDALRLAVKLKIDLRFPHDNDMYVDAGDCDAHTVYLIDANHDRAAATRRAIVKAAAEIGRSA